MADDGATDGQPSPFLNPAPGTQTFISTAGGEYVRQLLYVSEPGEAIDEVQRRGALRDAACEPLVGLLDHMGHSRAEVYHEMLNSALELLKRRVDTMSTPALERLLDTSYPFIGIEELRQIPLAVLSRLNPVPASFLKQLAADMDLFRLLPRTVQRQVWEMDGSLFRRHASLSFDVYGDEVATVMRELDMGVHLTHPPGQAAPAAATDKAGIARPLPVLPRKAIRSASASIQRLVKLVESSKRLYASLVSLCRLHYIKESMMAACSLRSQLVLAFHESKALAGGACPFDVGSLGSFFELAKDLDACLKDGFLEHERLARVHDVVKRCERAVESVAPARKTVKLNVKLTGPALSDNSNGGESISIPEDTPVTMLADAAMILRDTPVFHMLLHETIRALQGVVEREGVPKDDETLGILTQLLTLACHSHDVVAHAVDKRVCSVPAVNRDIIDKFYPLLADLVLEAQLRDNHDEDQVSNEPDIKLVGLVQSDVVTRKVALAYIVQRLTDGDLASAKTMLLAVAQALTEAAVLDEGAFAATMARQLAALCSAGKLVPESTLWKAAVDGILFRAVAASVEVHEEVLRLFLAAASRMTPAYLAYCLDTTLSNSKRSRKQHKRRRIVTEYEYDPGASSAARRMGGSDSTPAGYQSPGYISSSTDGYSTAGDSAAAASGRSKAAATDGVRATYALIASQESGRLTEDIAPRVFEYLRQS